MSASTNKRNKYSPEFKDQVLARAEKEGVVQVAKDLGLPESMIYNWRLKKRNVGKSFEKTKLQEAEIASIKRETARLKMENEFLKKVSAYFVKDQA